MSILRFPPLRRAGFILGIMLAAAYVTVALLGPNGVSALVRQRQELNDLQMENANLEKMRNELRENVQALGSDPEAQELAARGVLGKVKKNEKVIKVSPPQTPSNNPQSNNPQ